MKDWEKLLRNYKLVILLIGLVLLFFYKFFVVGRIPLPGDTIVGLFHPFRDVIWDDLVNGVPVKNPLITDPVRQQYVWRYLSIENLKNFVMPLWNPYSFSGTPLLANFQSAPFYPLNIVFFILPFSIAWTLLIIAEPLLAGIFLYIYLQHMKIGKIASFLGGFVFAFSGFSIAWMTWNTIIHTILWLPLILLAKEHLLKKFTIRWIIILLFAEISQIFAGHLQLLFYALVISNVYLLSRIIQLSLISTDMKKSIVRLIKKYIPFLGVGLVVFTITAVQWLPTLQFISLSARNFDQGSWTKSGWFIPWQNLIQFIAPDFFGNPATNNYWGVWNYGEFIGYIGIIPLALSLYALLFRKDKKTLFFGTFVFLSLIFSLPTPLARLPFEWGIPLLSTSQPTRILFIIDFCLSVLVALGLDQFLKEKNLKKITFILIVLTCIVASLWVLTNQISTQLSIPVDNITIARHNLILPGVVTIVAIFLFASIFINKNRYISLAIYIIILVTVVDLFRFGWKFTPFTKSGWIFPQVRLLKEISQDNEYYRFLTTDRRIMPPNFSNYYHISDVAGYDPLYIKKYGELVAAWGRGKPDISPASFNRILTPQDYSSPIADLLGVKYVMSFQEEKSPKLKLRGKEGMTKLYENLQVLPRVFLVNRIIKAEGDQDEINSLFANITQLSKVATSQNTISVDNIAFDKTEKAKIILYDADKIQISTITSTDRLLVLTDIYYPTWKVSIDGRESELFSVDYTLRGVVVPKGKHMIEMSTQLF